MPLHEVADTDPETGGPTEERGGPVQNEAGVNRVEQARRI